MLPITTLYAVLLVPLYVILTLRVVVYRRTQKVAYGDKDYATAKAMIWAHGNFAEYAPFTLLLMALAEVNGIGTLWLHIGGLLLLVGRWMHGLGMAFRPKAFRWRIWGMYLTFFAMILAGILSALSIL